jgi:hypothetical protein
MWESRRLTTLSASTACYWGNLSRYFLLYSITGVRILHMSRGSEFEINCGHNLWQFAGFVCIVLEIISQATYYVQFEVKNRCTVAKMNVYHCSLDRLCGLVVRVPEVPVRFPELPDFLRSSGSGTQPREYNCGATWMRSSVFGLDVLDYGRRGSAALTTRPHSILKIWH